MPLRTWSAGLFAYARISVLAFVFLTFGSMTLYPGGTYVNRQSRGYDVLRNFLSDLGMPLSWGNQANPVGAFLFVSGEVCLATGLLAFFVAFVRLSATAPRARNWGRAAAVVGIVVALALIAAGLTPANRLLTLHVQAALIAFRGAFVATALLAAAIVVDRRFSATARVSAIAMAIVLGGYAAAIQWGPRVVNDVGLVFQATAQKIAFGCSMAGLFYLSRTGANVAALREHPSDSDTVSIQL